MIDDDNRSPEEIERAIERTREDFTSTIDAIQHKLAPSEMMDRAVDYALSTTPGAFSVNLVNSVRDNPIPVTLIGIGIAWLMSAGRRDNQRPVSMHQRTHRAAFYPDADAAYDDAYYSNYASSRDTGDGIMGRAASRTRETAHDMREKASETAQEMRERASNAGQRVSASASAMTDRVQQAAQDARFRLQESAAQAQARMGELGRRSQEQLHHARDRFSSMVDEQPLVLGALGIALGAALGAMVQPTRRENEVMGGMRDDLMERAKETAREQAETVRQSAQRVAETARQEAERVKSELANTGTQGGDSGSVSSSPASGPQPGGLPGSQSIH